jgi:hypothetical protein
MVRSDALTLTLSHRERENTPPVGPVSEAPPGDWAALRLPVEKGTVKAN